MFINDNHFTPGGGSFAPCDCHGSAALLLIEILIHDLCQKSILSITEAADLVDEAADVQRATTDAADGSKSSVPSYTALLAIAASLRVDDQAIEIPPVTYPTLVT